MTQECRVCGRTIQSNAQLPMQSHAGKHVREFIDEFGRVPENYEEVREKREELGYVYEPEKDKPITDSVERAQEFIQRWA